MHLADSPGTIALPTHEMGRFLLFTVSIAGTNQPPNCFLNAAASASVTENLNRIMPIGAAIGAGYYYTYYDGGGITIAAGTGNGIGLVLVTGTGQLLSYKIAWEEA